MEMSGGGGTCVEFFSGLELPDVSESIEEFLEKNPVDSVQHSMTTMDDGSIVVMLTYKKIIHGTQGPDGLNGPGSPMCKKCGVGMVKRYRNSDKMPFWGCPKWPVCTNTLPYAECADDNVAEYEHGDTTDDDMLDDGIPF